MRDALARGLRAFLLLRVIASVAALFSLMAIPTHRTVPVAGYDTPVLSGLAEALFGVWLRADALWYLKIADQGYGPELGTFAFFPLFPLLTALVAPMFFGRELLAAIFVSNLAVIAGFAFFYLLVKELLNDERSAEVSTLGLAIFPTSFFLVAPYAESLLLAFGALSLLMAARGRPWAAATAGVFAALARPFGVLLAIPLAGFAIAKGRRERSWKQTASALGPVVGLLGWLAFVSFQTGDAMFAFRVQSLWQRQLSFFGLTFIEGVTKWLDISGTTFGPYLLFDLVITVIFISLVVACHLTLRRRKGLTQRWAWGLTIYPLAMILIALTLKFGPRPLLSVPRFVLAGFTAFVAISLLHRRVLVVLGVISASGLFLASALYVAARPIF